MAVNLRMPSGVFVGGQAIRGEAELHFPDILEDDIQEIHVKLRGYLNVCVFQPSFTFLSDHGDTISIITKRIPARDGQAAHVQPHHTTLALIRENVSVWNHTTHPSPSTGQVTLVPFQFVLPPNVLPSFDWQHGRDERGSVSYFVEIVGTREGMLHWNRRVRVAFPVLPLDYQGAMVNRSLRNRVPYPTRTWETHKEMRRGIWGGYANATLQVRDV